jgi:hypothetical protein
MKYNLRGTEIVGILKWTITFKSELVTQSVVTFNYSHTNWTCKTSHIVACPTYSIKCINNYKPYEKMIKVLPHNLDATWESHKERPPAYTSSSASTNLYHSITTLPSHHVCIKWVPVNISGHADRINYVLPSSWLNHYGPDFVSLLRYLLNKIHVELDTASTQQRNYECCTLQRSYRMDVLIPAAKLSVLWSNHDFY